MKIILKNNSQKSTLKSTISSQKNESLFFDNLKQNSWLNTREASAYLSLSPNALRIMVHRGLVKSYRLSNRLRFKMSDLDRVLSIKQKGIKS